MRDLAVMGVAAAAMLAGGPATAQETAERYRLERSDSGYVRMDTGTGRISLCSQQGEQLVCRMASEDMDAYDRDIEALRARVDALETRLAALEGGKRQGAGLPDEQEFEQTLGYMERFFRRFMSIVREFEGETDTKTPDAKEPPATPGRT